MSLEARIIAAVQAIGLDVKALFTRALPAGGTTGQVLAKTSATDYAATWQTPSGGGGSTDPLDLVASNPAAPAANTVRVFGRKVGGRMMAAFKGPSGLDSSLQPSMARNNFRFSKPQGNGTVIAANGLTLTAAGTATAANYALTNMHTGFNRLAYLVTTAATTAVAGARHALAQFAIGTPGNALGGFHFVWRFGPATGTAANATRRGFCGFTSLTAAPTNVDPSGLANVLGVGCDAADVNYFIMHRTGTGTVVKVNTGIAKSAADATEAYELAMFCAPGGTSVFFEFTRFALNGVNTVFEHTATSSLPAATTLLAPQAYYSVGGTSSVIGLAHMGLSIETDF